MEINDTRKIALIGCGMVGMSYAYALLNHNACDELVLIDCDRSRAEGEAMDLSHGLAFSGGNLKIYAGTYEDIGDADIAVICAGTPQKPGESRTDLTGRNASIVTAITRDAIAAGFRGIFLLAANPVDILSMIVWRESGFAPGRVIGTGTTLDSARLRYLLGEYFDIDPRNVHAYVMGEHGDSEFIPWSQAMAATKAVLSICEDNPDRFRYEDLITIGEDVRHAAQAIISAKGATYYGIGMSLLRITKAIFGNENSVLTVSSLMEGDYGQRDVYAGSPCIIGRKGVKNKIRLSLSDYELSQMEASCSVMRSICHAIL